MSHNYEWEELIKNFKNDNEFLTFKYDTIDAVNKGQIQKILNIQQLKLDDSGNMKSLLIQKHELVSILDHIKRQNNLIAAQSYMIEKSGIGAACNGCAHIDQCIFNPGAVDNCQEQMLAMQK